ncbi:MAG: hypothetical protein WD696_09895 [Bryobacteraceae bacterium]
MAVLLTPVLWADAKKTPPEPSTVSIHPLAGRRGSTYPATIRGVNLGGAHTVWFEGQGVRARVLRVEPEPDAATEKPADLLHAEVTVDADAPVGAHPFRVVTPFGVTNEIVLPIVEEPVIGEKDPIPGFPVIVNGRLVKRGEVDAYWIEAGAGQTLTFEISSGHAAFDPSVSLYEPSGSWFDSDRLNRIAFHDEPLFFPGLPTDGRLVHRFAKAGKYCVKVQAFSGRGGPDFVYRLRITPEATPEPALHPKRKADWEERLFTRRLGPDWMARMIQRAGRADSIPAPEAFRGVAEDSPEPPLMTIPGVVEGRIAKPAETHIIRLKVDKPRDLAIEIETPEATMPRFNPVVRLMAPHGGEVATNVHTKRNNNGLYMMKMIQAKTTLTLRAAGVYLLQVRDITTDRGGPDFAYRVLVRPQIPHVGKVEVAEDRVNLEAGAVKPITINIEREEEFGGFAAVSLEGLPRGVTAVTGMEKPVERPPLPNAGRLERYVPKPQTSTVLLVAAPDAPVTETPVNIRVIARPAVEGRLGEPILVKEIPMMVVARRPS